jgi:hypothetical protein
MVKVGSAELDPRSLELLGARQSNGRSRSFAVPGISVRRLPLELSNRGHVAITIPTNIDEEAI